MISTRTSHCDFKVRGTGYGPNDLKGTDQGSIGTGVRAAVRHRAAGLGGVGAGVVCALCIGSVAGAGDRRNVLTCGKTAQHKLVGLADKPRRIMTHG